MLRVAINGLGRVGRSILKQYATAEHTAFELVAANDLTAADNLAYLIRYDSAYGRFDQTVTLDNDKLIVADKTIALFNQAEPEQLPWAELGIDVVLECSGKFCTHELASRHLQASAQRVLASAPVKDADVMIVLGVNESAFDPQRHFIISNASCTTNSLAPVLALLLEHFGIEHAMVTTVHAYTISQSMVDSVSKKIIRGRAGAVNIIPTDTGADKATSTVIPELAGRLTALAVRVPVLNGSLTDISVTLSRPTSVEQVNMLFKEAAESHYQGIIGYTDEPLVSSDIIGDPRSAIVHGLSTRVIGGSALKLHVWYDNEFAYAKRCLDLLDILPFQ